MAKFSPEQTQAVIEVQQLIHDWAHELDVNNGLHVADLVTEDCVYVVRGTPRQGRAEVQKFYQERLASLSSQATGIPTQRHILSNLRVTFRSAVEVSISFGLIYFTTAGVAAGADRADPAAVADVRMDCRRDGDGHWRIAKFDSEQVFRRAAT
jgi:ketosteroid isomerase-like protein